MSDDFDKKLNEARIKIAIEKSEWYPIFKERDKFIKLLILSLVFIWIIMFLEALYTNFTFLTIILYPHLAWFLFCFPYFSVKIYRTSTRLALKKEEIVLNVYNRQTKDVYEIELITGIEIRFTIFYLKKHGYELEFKNNTLQSLKK